MTANNQSQCPLCNGPNQCGNSQAGAETCWCRAEHFPASLLDQLPQPARGKTCICQQCLQAQQPLTPINQEH